MRNITLFIPAERTAFVFGRDIAQEPVEFDAAHYPTDDESRRPAFVFTVRTLSQQVEIWPTTAEVIAMVRFLHDKLKQRARCPHQRSDE